MLNNSRMDVFQALADPTRRSILAMLASGERAAGEIVDRCEMTAPAVSQHLKALKQAHLVEVRAEAQRRIYRLRPEGLDEAAVWIDGVRRFWTGRLDRLEQELTKAKTKPRSKQ